jgi:sulfoxide reductase heme-binding subunit YedZ
VRLHRLVYPLTALALLHFFLQSKIDVSNPVYWSGLFLALTLKRCIRRQPIRARKSPLQ